MRMLSIIKGIKNPANFYFLLWTLYLLQGTLYDKSSIISKTLLMVILLISLKESYVMLRYYKYPPIFKSFSVLLIMYTIYAILFGLTGVDVNVPIYYETNFIAIIRKAYISILPIYVSYLYTLKGYVTEKRLQCWMIVFIVVSIAGFYALQRDQLELLMEIGSNREDVTNNNSYVFVFFLPAMLLYRNKPRLMYAGILVCMFFLIIGMKRGSFFIGCVVLFIIITKLFETVTSWKKAFLFGVVLVFILLFINLWDYMMATNEYFNSRIQMTLEGDDNGRSRIWNNIWNVFINRTSFFQIVFGRGSIGTMEIGENFAHNDWLEFLIDYGLVGSILFLQYWLRFYKETKSHKLNSTSRFCLFVLFVGCLMKTFFSMSIFSMKCNLTILLGFCLANGFEQVRNYKSKCIKQQSSAVAY